MKWFHHASGPETYYPRYLHFTDVVFIYIQEKNHLGSLYKLEEKDVKFNQPSKNRQFQFHHAITYSIKYRLIDSTITKLTHKVEWLKSCDRIEKKPYSWKFIWRSGTFRFIIALCLTKSSITSKHDKIWTACALSWVHVIQYQSTCCPCASGWKTN